VIKINQTTASIVASYLLTGNYDFDNATSIDIDIYKGTQPTNITAGWTRASYSSDLLITFESVSFIHPTGQPYIVLNTWPPTTNAIADGTAAWCAIYNSTGSSTYVVIGPVDAPSGSPSVAHGLVILTTLTIVNGVGYDIVDAAIGIKSYGDS